MNPTIRSLLVLELALFLPAGGWLAFGQQGPAAGLWVVNEGSRDVSVIDVDSEAVVATVSVEDPDGNGTPDTPADLCFTTSPGIAGSKVFVTQQGLISILDRASPALVGFVDVSRAIGEPSLVMRGCAASPPRRYHLPTDADPGSLVTKTFLDVAGTIDGNTPVWLVIDQDALLGLSLDPVVFDWGTLQSTGEARDVTIAGLPAGDHRHESFYTVVDATPGGPAPTLSVLRLSKDGLLWTSFSVETLRQIELSAASSGLSFKIDDPSGRRLPVWPQGDSGTLENLQSGGTCSPGGRLTHASVTGVGANSYTLFALDHLGEELQMIDPTDCTVQTFALGSDPRDLVTRGRLDWKSVYVANRGSDSIYRLNDFQLQNTIQLAPPGPACQKCPISLAPDPVAYCEITDLDLQLNDFDFDGSKDDIKLSWNAAECPANEYFVWCQCLDDDPDCPCYCDCEIEDSLCNCTGFEGSPPALAAGIDNLHDVIQGPVFGPIPSKNPWKKMGISLDGEFIHPDAGNPDAGWVYGVTLDDAPPN